MNRKDWYDKHKCCPKCHSLFVVTTLIGVFEVVGEDYEDNMNQATCGKCNWSGMVKDLIEETQSTTTVFPLKVEKMKLNVMVDAAAEAMKEKLCQKAEKGWSGWDDVLSLPIIRKKLIEHVNEDYSAENMIDIMNFAAFIWYQEKK